MPGLSGGDIARVETLQELGSLLRRLKRRHARGSGDSELTYRELAAKTGWSFSVIGEYFGGKTLPPTDRFDDLIRLLGAAADELAALATARDRVEERRRGERSGPGTARAVPRQLPAVVPHFTGRDFSLVPAIACVDGPPGVGKTSFAVAWAHRLAERFPDGQLFVNLRGFDPHAPAMPPAEALQGFLDALGVTEPPRTVDAQAGLFRSLCAGRRMLVLLDNARDAAQVRPLLPGAPGCAVIVTSRSRLTGLVATEGAAPIALGLLSESECRTLLRQRLGSLADDSAEAIAAIDEIIARCGRLPLALVIAAAQLATQPALTPAELAARLGRLDSLAAPEDPFADVRAVFASSYRELDEAAARLFRLLGLHPGPEFGAAAAAALTGGACLPALDALVRGNLLTEPAPGRFVMHDLVRLYAAELAGRDDAATGRMLDHYLGAAYGCDRLLNTHRRPLSPEPASRFDGDPLAWFDTERAVLTVMVGHAVRQGFDRHAWQLAWSLSTYLDRRGHWHEWVATQEAALGVADPAGQAQAHRGLAAAYTRLGNHEQALTHHRHLVDLYRRLGDRAGQADAYRNIGVCLERQGLYAKAREHAQLAHDSYEAMGDEAGQAGTLNELGWYHALEGRHREAVEFAGLALERQIRLGNEYGQAGAWDTLGYAHRHLGEPSLAIDCHERSLELVRRLGSRFYEAEVLRHLADAQAAAGDPAAARDSLRGALSILEEMGHPQAASLRALVSDGRR